MSVHLEFEGKKIDVAIKKACDQLGVSEEELQHEIVSYGSSGIFGLVGAKKAKIRVLLPVDTGDRPKTGKKRKDTKNESQKPEPMAPDDESLDESSEIAAFGKGVVERILDAISPESTVLVEKEKDRLLYKISGGNSGVLIGKRGQTLEAIQYIVEKIIKKKCREKIRVQVDVEGYLENRKDSLRDLAGKLAAKVKKTGKPVTVGHMTANDRKIVHLALKKDKNVRTQSMGDGFIKKLVIFPRRNQSRKNKAV